MSNDKEIYTIKGRFECVNKKMVVVKVENKAYCVMPEEEFGKIKFSCKKNQRKIHKKRKYIEKHRKLA